MSGSEPDSAQQEQPQPQQQQQQPKRKSMNYFRAGSPLPLMIEAATNRHDASDRKIIQERLIEELYLGDPDFSSDGGSDYDGRGGEDERSRHIF